MIRMDLFINILIGLLVVLFLYRQFVPPKGVQQLNTEDVRPLLKNKKHQLIDVRTPGEFQANHIKGFKNIPLQQLKQRHQELSKEKNIVVICQSGMRSNKAARTLKKLGFQQVSNVRGGMSAWRA